MTCISTGSDLHDIHDLRRRSLDLVHELTGSLRSSGVSLHLEVYVQCLMFHLTDQRELPTLALPQPLGLGLCAASKPSD